MTTSKPVSEMTAEQILGDRKWPAHMTVEQMRGQLRHEEAGCPAPFPGAIWNGLCYVNAA